MRIFAVVLGLALSACGGGSDAPAPILVSADEIKAARAVTPNEPGVHASTAENERMDAAIALAVAALKEKALLYACNADECDGSGDFPGAPVPGGDPGGGGNYVPGDYGFAGYYVAVPSYPGGTCSWDAFRGNYMCCRPVAGGGMSCERINP